MLLSTHGLNSLSENLWTYLNALIDERISALKKPKKEGKQVTFARLKEACKYFAAKKSNDDSFSDEE